MAIELEYMEVIRSQLCPPQQERARRHLLLARRSIVVYVSPNCCSRSGPGGICYWPVVWPHSDCKSEHKGPWHMSRSIASYVSLNCFTSLAQWFHLPSLNCCICLAQLLHTPQVGRTRRHGEDVRRENRPPEVRRHHSLGALA